MTYKNIEEFRCLAETETMWIAMRHRHNNGPIMESHAFGPFEDYESAKEYAVKFYGGNISFTIHDVRVPDDEEGRDS
jgi:hypothetical protein